MTQVDAYTTNLRKLHRLLGILRTVSPTLPVQVAQSLILVALNEGKTLTELATLAGAKQSTMSRHLLDLGHRNRNMEPGHGLVVRTDDPMDLRSVRFTLSEKGKLLLQDVVKLMELNMEKGARS